MKETLSALYELQKLDIAITRANSEIAALTASAELRTKYAHGKSALAKAEKTLTSGELEVKDCELRLKSIDEKRNSLEKRMYSGSISNPKELSATEKEIEQLKKQQGELDVRTLELYEQVEASREKLESVTKIVQSIENKLRQVMKHEAQEKARLEADIKELTAKREATASAITNKQVMAKYEAIRKRTSSSGIAKVMEGKCEGCHVSVTSYTISNLWKGTDIQTCENCGRILMMHE